MNRELTVTLTQRSVFNFTWRTLDKQPQQRQLNWTVCWLAGAEMIKDESVKKKRKEQTKEHAAIPMTSQIRHFSAASPTA